MYYSRVISICLWLCLVASFSSSSFGADFLRTAETHWGGNLTPSKRTIQFSFFKISPMDTAELFSAAYDVGYKEEKESFFLRIPGLGNVRIGKSPEDDSTVLTISPRSKLSERALFPALKRLSDTLRVGGAKLSQGKRDSRTSVVQEVQGTSKEEKVANILNSIRNVTRREHVDQMKGRGVSVSSHRYPKGLMAKAESPDYAPTPLELFGELVYKDALSHVGIQNVDSLTIEEAQKIFDGLTKAKKKAALASIKQPALALGLENEVPKARKTIQMLKELTGLEHGGFEFTFNNTWDFERPLRSTSGIVWASHQIGALDHDKYLKAVSGLRPDFLKVLRKKDRKGNANEPLVVHYLLANPDQRKKTVGTSDYDTELKSKMSGIAVGFLSDANQGKIPVQLRHNSVVWHPRTFHNTNLLGQYNPGLMNRLVVQAITDHRYLEYRFWDEQVKGVMPHTQYLSDLVKGSMDPRAAIRKIRAERPEGFVIKGARDQSTGLFVITDSTDLEGELEKYLKSDFDEYHRKAKIEFEGRDIDDLVLHLQRHPNFKGWKVSELLRDPEYAVIQERLPLVGEFRVQSIGGKVIGNGASLDRHRYSDLDDPFGEKFKGSSRKLVKGAEEYTQRVVNGLEPQFRGTPFSFDVGLLEDGTYRLIETNPGPEDGFFGEYWPGFQALHRFLLNYPEMARTGEVISEGMSEAEQVEYLKSAFKRWKFNPKELKRHKFTRNYIGFDIPTEDFGPETYTLVPPGCAKNLKGVSENAE